MNESDTFDEWLGRVVGAMNRFAKAVLDLAAAWLYEIERTLASLADQVIELIHAVEEGKRLQRRHPHPPRMLALRERVIWRWQWSPMYGRR